MPRHYEDSETRRRQVAEAALRTLVEVGVSGFTTKAVASRVGITDGTLFRHFGSKEEIVLEAMGLLEAQIDAALVFSTADPWTDLEHFFRHRAAFVGSEGSVGRLVFSDQLVHLAGEAGRQRVAAWRRRSVAFLLDRLSVLAKTSELRTDLSLPTMSRLVQGTLLTFAMQASLGDTGESLPADIDEAWKALRLLFTRSPS